MTSIKRLLLILTVLSLGFVPLSKAQMVDWFGYTNPALSNSVVTIKASPGPLLAYNCYNPNATQAWVQVFDAISGVVVGTTVAKRAIPVAGLSSTGTQVPQPPYSGAVGLQAAATTTSTGSTAPTTALACEFYYR